MNPSLTVRVKRPALSTTEDNMRAFILGTALALSAGAASAQAVYPSDGYGPHGYGYTAPAPLYDYAGPAAASPKGYGPLIYTPQLYEPSPAFPGPPAEPGYYTAHSVVVSQPLYEYAPGYWGPAAASELPDVGGQPRVATAQDTAASIPARTARHHGTRHDRMYKMSVNRTHKGSKLVPQ
jgi:hypothetical protein